MAKTPAEGLESLARNLEANTGKSVAVWVDIARGTGIEKHKPLVEYLKQEQGLTHGYANFVALEALAKQEDPARGSEDLVAVQYATKPNLKPLYDKLVAAIGAFGEDVDFSPKKAYVSLRRNKQFGILQPTTAQRLDVGLVLKDTSAEGRLEASGSFNTMLTHRVRVNSLDEIDSELLGWLLQAYSSA